MTKQRAQKQEEERFLEEGEAQVAAAWDEEDLGLDWDESEFQRIASEMQTERGTRPL